MRNKLERRKESVEFLSKVEELPFFEVEPAKNLIKNGAYLRILVSRYSKRGKLLRLKKGVYAAKSFMDNVQKEGRFSSYVEFLASAIYSPSYLSLEYVLQKHNILTEQAVNFTLVSRNKTARFTNFIGTFMYHKMKADLFVGFEFVERDGFPVCEASKAKALFDYLYFRKPLLVGETAAFELRLNMDQFGRDDKKEFNAFVELEGSKRLKEISKMLFGG